MIKVLIADDHGIVRNGLKLLLGTMEGIEAAGEARSGDEVLEALRHGHFDLILLDLTMPGMSGVQLIHRILATDTGARILVLSMHDDPLIAKRVLRMGASGFVTKGSRQETLLYAIHKVASGGRFLDPAIAEQMLFERPEVPANQPHAILSEREYQIMRLFAQGRGIKEIAEELFISPKTVSTHKARMMRKMNFQHDTEIVRYAIDRELID